MNVELRWLRALVAVVDAGTFTDAAIDLGVSQATVSRAVAALEAELGVRVLRRTTRTVAPTAAGAAVVRRARRVLAEVDALAGAATEDAGSVRLGYAWSALGRHTAAIQRRWAAAHPGGRVELVLSDTPTAGVLEGVADIGVVRREVEDRRFATRLVGTERRVVAVSADDPWARRRFVRIADLAGRTVAMNARTGTTREALLEQAGAGPVRRRETGSVEDWLNVIAAGEAVGMTSQATAEQHQRPGVVYRPVRDADPVPVLLVWWRDDPPPALPELTAATLEAYNA